MTKAIQAVRDSERINAGIPMIKQDISIKGILISDSDFVSEI